jgi:hypothetical protein
VAAVLEGFEGTLDAVLELHLDDELRRELEELQAHIAGKRQHFEVAEPPEPVTAVS